MLVLMIVLALLAAPPVAPDVARPASAPNVSQAVNSAFVQAAFTVVLNRTPAQADVAYWIQAGQTRTSVVQSLINSPEFRRAAITALFQHFLARAPGQADFANPLTFAQIAAEIAGSAEYYQKAGGTNDAFLAHLYTDALGRPIDAQGAAYWNAQFGAGLSISGVAGALVQSPEGSSYETVLLYQNAMHRSGTPSGPTLTSAALAAAEQMMH
jgi:hypothetical protein